MPVSTYVDSPSKVLDGGIILVLPYTFVSMDVYIRAVMRDIVLQVVMQKTDGTICSLANVVCFINEIVDLGSGAGGFTCNTKNLALSSSKEVCWSGLQRIVRIVDLLGKIVRIVHASTLLPNRVPI